MKLQEAYNQFILYGTQMGYANVGQLAEHMQKTFELESYTGTLKGVMDTVDQLAAQGIIRLDKKTQEIQVITPDALDESHLNTFKLLHSLENFAYQRYVQRLLHLSINRIKEATIETLSTTMGGNPTLNYQHLQYALAHLEQAGFLTEKENDYFFDVDTKSVYDLIVKG